MAILTTRQTLTPTWHACPPDGHDDPRGGLALTVLWARGASFLIRSRNLNASKLNVRTFFKHRERVLSGVCAPPSAALLFVISL